MQMRCLGLTESDAVTFDPGVCRKFFSVFPHADTELGRDALAD